MVAKGAPRLIGFPGGCNVRREPNGSADVIGWAKTERLYRLIEVRGGWVKIELERSKVGWAGCKTK